MAIEVSYREVDLSKVRMTIESPDLAAIAMDWENESGERELRGVEFLAENPMTQACMLDFANRARMAECLDDDLRWETWMTSRML